METDPVLRVASGGGARRRMGAGAGEGGEEPGPGEGVEELGQGEGVEEPGPGEGQGTRPR